MLDVCIGTLKSLMKSKVAEANGEYIEVPTQKVKPSQTYPSCGNQVKKELSERIHNCIKRSYIADRDVAAAQVMVNWGLYNSAVFGTNIVKRGGSSSTPSATYCGGMQQLSSKKRKQHTRLDGISETPSSFSRVG